MFIFKKINVAHVDFLLEIRVGSKFNGSTSNLIVRISMVFGKLMLT